MKGKSIEQIKAKIKAQNGGNEIKTGDMLRYMNKNNKTLKGMQAQVVKTPAPKTLPVGKTLPITNKVKILI